MQESPPRRPWWTYTVPWPGRVPPLSPRQWSVMGLLAAAEFFDQYDVGLLGLALAQIQQGLAIPEEQVGRLTAVVRLGVLPALAMTVMADRLGRRRLLLATILGFTLATFATAFAPDPTTFAALQFLARFFIAGETMLAVVVVTEELRARDRGWGIGMLGALGAVGYGAGILLFGAIDLVGGSWRLLYLLGITPVLCLPAFRRRVLETRRFEAQARRLPVREALANVWRPLADLLRLHPARALGIGAVALLSASAMSSALQYSAYFVQTVHGWLPWHYAVMALTAGALGILGNAWAGRMADARGRRSVGFVLMATFPLWAFAFFRGPELFVPLAWIALIFSLTGTGTVERALGTELFPTSQRGTASGWVQLAESLGRFLGFGVIHWATPEGGSAIPALLGLSLASLVGACAILLLPETGRRELEEISG